MLSLKFRMTFVVAFHTTDQEAPANNDLQLYLLSPGVCWQQLPPVSQAGSSDADCSAGMAEGCGDRAPGPQRGLEFGKPPRGLVRGDSAGE